MSRNFTGNQWRSSYRRLKYKENVSLWCSRFVPNDRPKLQIFPQKGIRVEVISLLSILWSSPHTSSQVMSIVIQRSKSSRQHVFLFDLQLEASGTYRCEVQHNQNSDEEECNDDNDEWYADENHALMMDHLWRCQQRRQVSEQSTRRRWSLF